MLDFILRRMGREYCDVTMIVCSLVAMALLRNYLRHLFRPLPPTIPDSCTEDCVWPSNVPQLSLPGYCTQTKDGNSIFGFYHERDEY